MRKYLFLAIVFMSTSRLAFGADEAFSQELSGSLKVHSGEPSIFSIIFALFFVICLIYITGIVYSKLNLVGANTVKKQLKDYDLSHVVVLSTTQLGQGKNLHVVEVDKKKLLIGAAPNSVNLVKELGEKSESGEVKSIEEVFQKKEQEIIAEDATEEVLEEFTLHKKYL